MERRFKGHLVLVKEIANYLTSSTVCLFFFCFFFFLFFFLKFMCIHLVGGDIQAGCVF